MSLTATLRPAGVAASRWPLRLALAAGAVLAAAALLGGIAWALGPAAAPPPRSPFGIGFREAAPATTGLGGWLLAVQSNFSSHLRAAVTALKAGGPWMPLIVMGFAYGVFHAAGPGHGKAVIAGYIVAGERTLRRGFALSAAAALLQALVAIAIVLVGVLVLNTTAAGMTRAGTLIETVSFALVAGLGAAVTWRKAGRLAGLATDAPPEACGPGCGHTHLTDAAALDRLGGWRERAGVVLAAGSRPCAGAVLILVFCAAQGLLAAGIAATFAMALGTALTTGALASLAVFAKALALRLAGGRGQAGALAVGGLELLAGAFVLVLGLAMLSGLATGLGG
ncbi:nickel/cobalt transporter [Methylorubrum extorquens]|uniref:Nickel/cobalt efflux system n=1 Tax=Methylorubrum extorquens TaxID=408 RepID=A0A2N9AVB6_METEX|nr:MULTISPECIES: nickel transporter [Methylorubrum]KQP92467.1 nickel transporter [Methylobacterium sp. Leaf119]ABY29804.1 high-affinity nickel-transporter [Methylorubrum extorquens PA1]ARO55221.1 nickel transporter [Methylorubrum zatmanii]WIU41122.1 nickel transporter [Methylorubrum extorquens]SOR31218.1 High-affinity nickel-transporter [Methylorubrum extorquens]